MFRSWLLLSVVLAFASPSRAQPTPESARPDTTAAADRLEDLFDPRSPGNATARRWAETLSRLSERPLNVNAASSADLSLLPPLSLSLARRIVAYRRAHGPYGSVREIENVDGLTRSDLRLLSPFLTTGSGHDSPADSSALSSLLPSLSALDVEILQRISHELDRARGYRVPDSSRGFRGSPAHLTTRVRIGAGRRAQLALTVDKDPGEALRWQPSTASYGFDHVAGNLTIRHTGPLETLVLGDFTAEFGQGLVLWQGLSFGKGQQSASSLARDGRGLVPFQSTSESRYFRGAGVEISLPLSFSASAFLSRRSRDATLDSTASSAPTAPVPARTLSTGGLHRTRSERQREDRFGVTTVGGALAYRKGPVRAGIVGYRSRFDRPLRPPDDPYRRFDLSGRHSEGVGLYGSVVFDAYTVFGEVARSATGGSGTVAGAALHSDNGVRALVLARRYGRSFPGLYNAGIGESGDPQNEVGVYTGVQVQLSEEWRVDGYVDQYRFPWLRFSVPRPSTGFDAQVGIEYVPRPWLSTTLEVETEHAETGTERPGPGGRSLAAVAVETRHSAEWHLEYTFSDLLTLRSELQLSRVDEGAQATEHGVLLYQGVRLQPISSLQVDARVALFDTDSYASRLYTYEHDLLYSFSVPVLYGRGQRAYVLFQYEPTETLTLEAKYGVTWYPYRDDVGTGLGQVRGNEVRELRVQVRWRL